MKKFTQEEKIDIATALKDYCDKFVSRNRAVDTLKDVSAATVSQMINNKFDSISDDMLMKVSIQIGYSFDGWQIHESDTFKKITMYMQDSQLYYNIRWIVGEAGCGKTTTAINYARNNRNVFYILCSQDMQKSDFVKEIAKKVGAPTDSCNLREILSYVVTMIGALEHPLLIFDEGDKLTDNVFYYFINLYNMLEGRCGIVFLSTDYIKKRMASGLSYNKQGYKEVSSRIGRRFFDVTPAAQNDIAAICMANGLSNQVEIKKVLKEAELAENDLRRVKDVIHARVRLAELRKE